MPKFEEFDRQAASPHSKWPIVSIRTRGTFGINRAAYEALGRPKAVKLLWDAEDRAVGFRPSHENSPKAYTVSETKPNSGSCEVAGTKFFKHYNIPYDRCRRYAAEMDDGDLVFYLDRDEKQPTANV